MCNARGPRVSSRPVNILAPNRHVWCERKILKNRLDARLPRRRGDAKEAGAPSKVIVPDDGRRTPEMILTSRGLSGPIVTDKAGDLSVDQVHRDVGERRYRSKVHVDALGLQYETARAFLRSCSSLNGLCFWHYSPAQRSVLQAGPQRKRSSRVSNKQRFVANIHPRR